MAPMADSDSDYVASSGEEASAHILRKGRSGDKASRRKSRPREKKLERWEEVKRSWDTGLDDDKIASTVAEIIESTKKRRLQKYETPLQRGIIRHVVLIIDLSSAMEEKDLRPTRYLLTIRYACEFVQDFFEENPISQLAIIGMRDGLAVRICDASGNSVQHVEALQKLRLEDPVGTPSLQNALEMARGALFHAPKHGTREIVIIYGALSSADPGDIQTTIRSLIEDKVRVTIVGLAAQVAVCREIVKRTNSGDDKAYGVAMDEHHFKELLIEATIPPVTMSAKVAASGMLMMGFPSRMVERVASLCACHQSPTKGGYLCPRCSTKVCALPIECPSCSLTLILSTHLARSYHHLFPLRNFKEVPWREADKSTHCFGCHTAFPLLPAKREDFDAPAKTKAGTSVSSRYRCPECGQYFCIDCDVYCHETLYNCPACQSLPDEVRGMAKKIKAANGSVVALAPGSKDMRGGNEPMMID